MAAWMRHPDNRLRCYMPSHKRKTFEHDDISAIARDSHPPPAAHAKRRRCDVLEHGLAQLSLENHVDGRAFPSASRFPQGCSGVTVKDSSFTPLASNNIRQPSGWAQLPQTSWPTPAPSYPTYSGVSQQPIVLPGSIEEPTSSESTYELPDVQMKNRSWYEPEKDRIVITDLEGSDTEDSESEIPPKKDGELTVSPALLDRLSKQAMTLPSDNFQESDTSKALVLFRPLIVSHVTEPEDDVRESDKKKEDIQAAVVDEDVPILDVDDTMDAQADDAMEIELL
ncbi:uncharacterized protein LAESUDRAFT_365890 [Laetiporus sulphureus 93-53]|uniref:Uncharacterized protein n=1 Tax=Laetiporus sulphureus 93-53 TaxID=1314785 RepID=A0A165H109_9APHY|nr:uncharacterized protein LAESUDRAFT_365890 [Laetiporus sulphureus 93-53]KZT11098.1 hypothetical protein LAESUDRAFT_365890 [Laetiporus sulphureus 93-53]